MTKTTRTVAISADRHLRLDLELPETASAAGTARVLIQFPNQNRQIPTPEIARKLGELSAINNTLEKLNKTEPLSPEFDEILSQRVNFTKALDW